ncbi:Restriction endonuclease [Bradyrhizobium sp. Rc2d]|uniref:restriction endonuclease n=1 Tax=Bradyrhizobium sp. Rc2d TaxID=1855321 RepID=UPI00088B97D1|nr:restriction endonuclease [Bradyrhizobium sp. Rc2d]SDH43832.1 Restriction endonuclease [Bradyrhizobium sp. Rc2d]
MKKPTLYDALEQFEAIEANVAKLERLCGDVESLIPTGISFCSDPAYEDKCRAAAAILEHMPAIDGWQLKLEFFDLDEIAQIRFDLAEIMEPAAEASFENSLQEPSRQLREYRFRFNRKRRQLIRHALDDAIDQVDRLIRATRPAIEAMEPRDSIPEAALAELRTHFKEITTLMGSSMPRPDRWNEMGRHLHFGQACDFDDVEHVDWPAAKASLRKSLYGQDDPIAVNVGDLRELIASKPSGPIPTKLNWAKLTEEQFERLIFSLIACEPGYENPEWLTQTRAADKGRDLSVTRVAKDGLSGHLRARVIIQCKHWLERSISPTDVALLKEQMALWEPPRVDVLTIATSGRFTADAVAAIEKQGQADRALRIEMWPESHLEMLLAARPALIAEFGLR